MSFRRRFRDLRDFISFSVISLQAFGIDAELAIAQLVISIEHHASVSSLVTLISGHLGRSLSSAYFSYALSAFLHTVGEGELQHRHPPQEKHKASLSRPLCHLSSLLHLTLLSSGLERPVPRQRARRRRARRSAGSGGLEGSWRAKAAESRGDCIVGIARQGVAGTMVPLVGGCGHRAGGQRLSSLFPLHFAASRKGAKKGTVV